MNAGSPTRINDVLIRDGEEITLLDSEFVIGRSDTLHVLDNLYVGQVSGRKSGNGTPHPHSTLPAQRGKHNRHTTRAFIRVYQLRKQ